MSAHAAKDLIETPVKTSEGSHDVRRSGSCVAVAECGKKSPTYCACQSLSHRPYFPPLRVHAAVLCQHDPAGQAAPTPNRSLQIVEERCSVVLVGPQP